MLFIAVMCSLSFMTKMELFSLNCSPKYYVSNYPELFKPLSFKSKELKYNLPNDIEIDIVESILSEIPITNYNSKFSELPPAKYDFNLGKKPFQYDEAKLIKTINILFNKIKYILDSKLSSSVSLERGTIIKSETKLLDKRIIKLAKHLKNIVIFGQLVININISSYKILIEYIISDKNNDDIEIYYLEVKGIELKDYLPGINKLDKNVKINSNILYNQYNADKTYLYDSNEPAFIIDKNAKIDNVVEEQPYKCFGRENEGIDTCENILDETDLDNPIVGVWDKNCTSDSDCDLNAKCIDGDCQYPNTVIPISPTQFVVPPSSIKQIDNSEKYNVEVLDDDEQIFTKIPSESIVPQEDGSFKINISASEPVPSKIRVRELDTNYTKILTEDDINVDILLPDEEVISATILPYSFLIPDFVPLSGRQSAEISRRNL